MTPRFAVLLPVKSPNLAKTRLDVPDVDIRAALVKAFVADTIEILRASEHVEQIHVVSADQHLDFGVSTLPDLGAGSLNLALSRAAESVDRRLVVAAILPDLPALRLADLDAALAEAGTDRCFVADHEGSGTTLLTAYGTPLDPHFGPDSAARHLASGARAITCPAATLRLDVDTLTDLALARGFGVGKNTVAMLPIGGTPPQGGA